MARKRNGRPLNREVAEKWGRPPLKVVGVRHATETEMDRMKAKGDGFGQVNRGKVRIWAEDKSKPEAGTQLSQNLRSYTRKDDGSDPIRKIRTTKVRMLCDTQTGRMVPDSLPLSKAARRKRNANLPREVRETRKRNNKKQNGGKAR